MILITCNTEKSMIKHLEISGHASESSKNGIICAAVSCLSRTVCDITTRLQGVKSDFSAPKPGNIVLNIHSIDNCIQEKFSGITDYFLFGVIGVARDYPDSVKLKINYKEWYDGSQKRWW